MNSQNAQAQLRTNDTNLFKCTQHLLKLHWALNNPCLGHYQLTAPLKPAKPLNDHRQ